MAGRRQWDAWLSKALLAMAANEILHGDTLQFSVWNVSGPQVLLWPLTLETYSLFHYSPNAQRGSQAEAKLLAQGSFASGSPIQGAEGGGRFLAESGPRPPETPCAGGRAGARQPGATQRRPGCPQSPGSQLMSSGPYSPSLACAAEGSHPGSVSSCS